MTWRVDVTIRTQEGPCSVCVRAANAAADPADARKIEAIERFLTSLPTSEDDRSWRLSVRVERTDGDPGARWVATTFHRRVPRAFPLERLEAELGVRFCPGRHP